MALFSLASRYTFWIWASLNFELIGPQRFRPPVWIGRRLLRSWPRTRWLRVSGHVLQLGTRTKPSHRFVEYETAADLKTAVEKLDRREFKGQEVTCIQDVSDPPPPPPFKPRAPYGGPGGPDDRGRDRYRSRSPMGRRGGGYPPAPYDDYYDRRGPPRGYSPRRDDYRRRTPPREFYDRRDGGYGRSPPRGRMPDEYGPPRARYPDDPYDARARPPPRGYDDPYMNGHGRPYEGGRPPSPRGARPRSPGGRPPYEGAAADYPPRRY